MRIALVSEKYPPDVGGLAVSVERLAQLLQKAGQQVQVFVITTDLEPGQHVSLERPEALVHRLGASKRTDDTLADWFDFMVARHAETPFDLLHAYFITQAGYVATYAGKFLGLPVVVSARGNDLDRAAFEPRKAAHILYALQNAEAVTANAWHLVRKAQALAPGREVSLIPNGVDTELFRPAPRPERLAVQLGLADEAVVGFVGEARSKKGLASLLLAFQILAARRNAKLLLVGGVRPGEDRELLEVFCKQNPTLSIQVIPYVETGEMPAYYSLMDVLVMPSRRDGLPNALLEGMACERAVVATPVGGIPDALRDGENGRLVPAGNAQALAGAIEALLDDPELRQRLGRAARATVLADFSISQELDKTLRLYRQLLPRKE